MSTDSSVATPAPLASVDAPRFAPPPGLLAIPHFRLLLLMQVLFWSSSSIFLMLPKYLAVQLHADAIWIGLIMGGSGLGSVLMAPAIGPLTRRWRRRRCLVTANLAMAFGGLLFIGVDAPGPLAVCARCLHGVAGALLYAHGTILVVDLVPRARVPSAIALYMTAGLLPNVVSPPLAEWLLAHRGPEVVFAGATVLALIGAALALRLPDSTPAPPPVVGLASVRPATGLLVVSLLFGVASGVVFTFHQPLAIARGVERVSDFLVTFTLTAAALRLLGGRLIDRLGSGRVACWSGAGYALVMLGMSGMGPGHLVVLGACFGATHGLFFPTFVAFALGRGGDSGREARMAWLGAADKLGYLTVAPLGLLAHGHGYPVLFVVAAVLLAIAVLILRRSGAAGSGAVDC